MESKNTKRLPLAFVITLAASGLAFGQDTLTVSVEPNALHALETGIAKGQKLKVKDKSDFKRPETLKSRLHLFQEFPNSTRNHTLISETDWRLGQAEQNEATLWMIRIIEHCCKCSSCEDCEAGGCRVRDGCPYRAGCN